MKAKSTINGVLKKRSLIVQIAQELSFLFPTSNTTYDEEKGGHEEFFAKKGSKINARETQGKHARAINTRRKRGNHLTGISPHNKCDETRIFGHQQVNPPKKTFQIPLLVRTNDDKEIKEATDK